MWGNGYDNVFWEDTNRAVRYPGNPRFGFRTTSARPSSRRCLRAPIKTSAIPGKPVAGGPLDRILRGAPSTPPSNGSAASSRARSLRRPGTCHPCQPRCCLARSRACRRGSWHQSDLASGKIRQPAEQRSDRPQCTPM